jgi:hypothetical protein
MVNSGKQLIPCETKISAYTGETPMPPWPLRLTPFPHTSGFLSFQIAEWNPPEFYQKDFLCGLANANSVN